MNDVVSGDTVAGAASAGQSGETGSGTAALLGGGTGAEGAGGTTSPAGAGVVDNGGGNGDGEGAQSSSSNAGAARDSTSGQDGGQSGGEPSDWRHRMAANLPQEEREKFLNEAVRSENEAAFAKRFLDLRQAQSRSIALPDEKDPERAAKLEDIYSKLGRPESVDKYEVKWDGPELNDIQRNALDDYKQVHFRNGGTQDALDDQLKWYSAQLKADEEAQRVQAEETTAQNHKVLKTTWGQDFDENVALYGQTMKTYMGDEDFRTFAEMRLSDGTFAADNPIFARMGARIGRERAADDFDYTPFNSSRKEDAQGRLTARQNELIQQGIRPGQPGYPQQEMDQLATEAAASRRRSPNERYMKRSA